MPNGDRTIDRSIPVHHDPAERHGFGADRQSPYRGSEMDAGPNTPVTAAQRCANRVPERPVMLEQGRFRRVDQFQSIGRSGSAPGKPVSDGWSSMT